MNLMEMEIFKRLNYSAIVSICRNKRNSMTETEKKDLFYGRPGYVLGSMQLLETSSVLISCCNGLGSEIAKNCVLCGVGKVHIHDVEVAKIEDLSSQVFPPRR